MTGHAVCVRICKVHESAACTCICALIVVVGGEGESTFLCPWSTNDNYAAAQEKEKAKPAEKQHESERKAMESNYHRGTRV